MNRLLIFSFCLLFSVAGLFAQHRCSSILEQAQAAYEASNYSLALEKLHDAETCDFKNELVAERQHLQTDIFEAIQRQKERAEADRQAAVRATRQAEQAQARAEAESKRSARNARANANALKALQIAKEDGTKALRLAEMNYHLYPESQTSVGIFREVYPSETHGYCQQTIQKGHTSYVYSVAFSPDGSRILTGSSDKTAKLWDLQGKEIQSFAGHTSSVNSVAFSPDGSRILTGSSDQTAKLWDLQGKEIQSFAGHTSSVLSVAFSPDEAYILTGIQYTIRGGGGIGRFLAPWTFLERHVEKYSLGELKALGLEYTQEDVEEMRKRREGKLW